MRKFLSFFFCLIVILAIGYLLGKDLVFSIMMIVFFALLFFLFFDYKIWFFLLIFTLPLIYQFVSIFNDSSTTFINLGICFTLYVIAIFVRAWEIKAIKVEFDYYKITLLILLLYLLFSIFIVSSNKPFGINKYIYFLASIFVMLIPSYIFSNKDDIKTIVMALFSLGFIYAIASYLQYLNFFTNQSNPTSIRFHLFSMNPISIARHISYSIPAIIFLIIQFSKNVIKNIGKIIILLLFLFSLSFFMALTGSKGPILALLISMLISYLLYQKKFGLYKGAIFINIMILAFVCISLYFLLPDNILLRLTSGDIDNQRTSIIRLFAIMEGLTNFKQNIIFGVGFGAYKFQTPFFGVIVYPHNIFIEFLSETGLIGFTLFSIILISTIKMLRRLYFKLEIFSFLFIQFLFISSLINANFSGHIGYNVMFWFSCGLIYSVSRLSDEK